MSPVRATPLCGRIRLSPLQGSFCLVRANPGLPPGLCAKGRAFSPRVERWLCKNNSRPRVLHSVDKRLTPAPKGLQVSSSRPPQGDQRSTRAPTGLQVPGPRPPQGQQAFNARPEGAMSSQPRASERSERHPGLGRAANDTPPEGAKAMTEGFNSPNEAFGCPDKFLLSLLLPPPGAYRNASCATQGAASLRSLALGWELVAPPGRALNAWKNPGCPPGRALNVGCLCGGRGQVAVVARWCALLTSTYVKIQTGVFVPTNPGFEKTNPGFGNSIAAIENPKPGFVCAVGGIGGAGPTGRAWSRRGLGNVGPLRSGGCPGS